MSQRDYAYLGLRGKQVLCQKEKNLTKQEHCTKGIPNSYQRFSLFLPADTLGKATIISLQINKTISQLVSPPLLTSPLSFSLFSIMEPGSILNYNYDHVTPLQKIVPLFCILVSFCHITIPSLSDLPKEILFSHSQVCSLVVVPLAKATFNWVGPQTSSWIQVQFIRYLLS